MKVCSKHRAEIYVGKQEEYTLVPKDYFYTNFTEFRGKYAEADAR